MRFPFVSRFLHDQMIAMLEQRCAELDQERRLYLDRLAIAGLGGPLFTVPQASSTAVEPDPEVENVDINEFQRELSRVRAMRTRPSQAAEAISKLMRKQHRENADAVARGRNVAKMPSDEIDRHLDEAVEAGKARAS